MKIKIVAVGKISLHLQQAQEYYAKRIPNLQIVEVKKKKTITEEGRELLKHAKGFIVVLDERGKQLNSLEFAKLISSKANTSFLIGGADGLSEEVKTKASFTLSLSKLTLQHDIARIVLLEQLYRAYLINKGSPYHRP